MENSGNLRRKTDAMDEKSRFLQVFPCGELALQSLLFLLTDPVPQNGTLRQR